MRTLLMLVALAVASTLAACDQKESSASASGAEPEINFNPVKKVVEIRDCKYADGKTTCIVTNKTSETMYQVHIMTRELDKEGVKLKEGWFCTSNLEPNQPQRCSRQWDKNTAKVEFFEHE